MDASWFLLVLSAAVLISLVLLVIVCLNCWSKGPMVSISQTNESEEYIPSTQFRVIHPHHQPSDIRSGSHLLIPQQVVSPSSDLRIPGQRRFTPTDNESNPSYENPTEVYPDRQDSDVDDPGYIIVIPDDPPRPSVSRASTPSSDNQHEYVNLAEDDERQEEEPEEDEQEDESNDEQDYQNVDPKNSLTAHSITPALSRSRPLSQEAGPAMNDATSESESSDDETGNYVNQPPMIHS